MEKPIEYLEKDLKNGILLLLFSASIYLIAYLYELGFCIGFSIPIEFIDIGLGQTITTGFKIFILGIIYIVLADKIFSYFRKMFNKAIDEGVKKKKDAPLADLVLIIEPIFSLILVFIIVFWKYWIVYLFTILLFILFCLVIYSMKPLRRRLVSILFYIKGCGFIETSNSEDAESFKRKLVKIQENNFFTLIDHLLGILDNIGQNILWIIIISLLISFCLGYENALSKEVFLVPENNKNNLVLRKYGDDLILGNYSKENNVLKSTIAVQNIGCSPIVLEKQCLKNIKINNRTLKTIQASTEKELKNYLSKVNLWSKRWLK